MDEMTEIRKGEIPLGQMHPAILSLDLRGNSADQISLPWIMIEGKNRLCYSIKVVEYSPRYV